MVPSLRQRGLQAAEDLAWGGLWVDRGLTGSAEGVRAGAVEEREHVVEVARPSKVETVP